MKKDSISKLRHFSRKLIRELGVLKLNQANLNRTPQHWHALIEISNEPNITISKLGNLLLLSASAVSRIVSSLLKEELIILSNGSDKREKCLAITQKGKLEIENIDEFSNSKIKGALDFLTEDDLSQIIDAMKKYSNALEKSRLAREQVKVHTLSTSRAIRKQIISMIEKIQKEEFSLPINNKINSCVLKAEEEFYFNNSYNFWYAVDDLGKIIGSIGLKKINQRDGEIKKFFVDANYRGRGVARKLIHALLKAASKHKFQNLYLGTVDTLHAAHRFYEKYGFAQIKESNLPPSFDKCELDSLFFKVKCQVLSNKLSLQMDDI